MFSVFILLILIIQGTPAIEVPICTAFHLEGSVSNYSEAVFIYHFDINITHRDNREWPNLLTLTDFNVTNLQPSNYRKYFDLYMNWWLRNKNNPNQIGFQDNETMFPDALGYAAFDIISVTHQGYRSGQTKIVIIDSHVFDGSDGHFMDPNTDITSDPSDCKLTG